MQRGPGDTSKRKPAWGYVALSPIINCRLARVLLSARFTVAGRSSGRKKVWGFVQGPS